MSSEETRAALVRFYETLSHGDGAGLGRLYTPDASFEDPVFSLRGADIGKMWTGLLGRARRFEVAYTVAQAGEKSGVVEWTARYLFAGKRPVVNVILSELELDNGLVARQRDTFDFRRWSAQALGLPGRLFGRMEWFRRSVSRKAALGLGVTPKP
ncbi:MAG TPA: nuclear transport factor 2 family protein [Thermoanaerobaculia bacterium]|nr:nuclear transport factor 2 family protein [Thermoanaerobaculia bacterium]